MRTAKAWVAFVGTVVTSLNAALSDDVFNASDGAQVVSTVVLAIATLYATYRVPNSE